MTRRAFVGSSATLAAMGPFGAEGAAESPRLAATKKWFKEAQFEKMGSDPAKAL